MHTKRKALRIRGAADAVARLKEEIALNRDFRGAGETAFLALVWTWQRLEALGRKFFPHFGITDVQFNVLMILWDYRKRELRQHELAEILVVNRASAGGVIARLERAGWIARSVAKGDTRARVVRLTPAGIAKLEQVRTPYYQLLGGIFRDNDGAAPRRLVEYLDTIRRRLPTARTSRPEVAVGRNPR